MNRAYVFNIQGDWIRINFDEILMLLIRVLKFKSIDEILRDIKNHLNSHLIRFESIIYCRDIARRLHQDFMYIPPVKVRM